jgi:hypothetical protein
MIGLAVQQGQHGSDGRHSLAPRGVTTIGRFTGIGCATIASTIRSPENRRIEQSRVRRPVCGGQAVEARAKAGVIRRVA